MSKNTIVYQHTDGRIFRLRVIPSPDRTGYGQVTINELKFGHLYVPRDIRQFEVAKFDTIVGGAMSCLYGYLAATAEENDIAKKWREFENRG